MRLFISLFFLFTISGKLSAQNIENVDFEAFEDHILVTYDLVNCPLNTVFDLTLVFVKPNGASIYPKNLFGDIESVKPGYKKSIKWFFRNDIEDYNGELKAVLSIKGFNLVNQSTLNNTNNNSNSSTSAMITNSNTTLEQVKKTNKLGGGAENVILSMLLPGFGDHFVNSNDHVSPLLISAIFIGSVYTAFSAKKSSEDNYAIYSKSRIQFEMDESFTKASEYKKKSDIALGVAASVWLLDVIKVAIQGSRNDRLRNNGYGKIKLIPRYIPTIHSDAFQLTFVKNF